MKDTESELKQSINEDRHLLKLIKKQLRQIDDTQQRDVLDRLKQFLGLKHYELWQWEELNRAYTSIQFEDPQSLPHLSCVRRLAHPSRAIDVAGVAKENRTVGSDGESEKLPSLPRRASAAHDRRYHQEENDSFS